jgi:transposase
MENIPVEEIEVKLDSTDCPRRGAETSRFSSRDRRAERFEFVPNPLTRQKYVSFAYRRPHRAKIHHAQSPETRLGFFGPNLMSFLLFLKGKGRVSVTGLRDVSLTFGLRASRGVICGRLDKAAAALGPAYDELREALQAQKVLNVDETGHKENGHRLWTWVFRAKTFAFFSHQSRPSDLGPS